MAKILLVEDDNNLREIYGERLMAEGYEIISASDGEEALQTAVQERPDLIISDVMMPKISGFDMLDILRQTPETKNVKIIMMTALSQAEDKARADKLGADKYLVKSQVTLEDVARVVHNLLNDAPEPSQNDLDEASKASDEPKDILADVDPYDKAANDDGMPFIPSATMAQSISVQAESPITPTPQATVPEPSVAPAAPVMPVAEPAPTETPITPTPQATVPEPSVAPAVAPVMPVAEPAPTETPITPTPQATVPEPSVAPAAPAPVVNPITGEISNLPAVQQYASQETFNNAQAPSSSNEIDQVAKQIENFVNTQNIDNNSHITQAPAQDVSQRDIDKAAAVSPDPNVIPAQPAQDSSTHTTTPPNPTIPPITPMNTHDPEPASSRKKIIQPVHGDGFSSPDIHDLYEQEMAKEAASTPAPYAVNIPQKDNKYQNSVSQNSFSPNSKTQEIRPVNPLGPQSDNVGPPPLETMDASQITGFSNNPNEEFSDTTMQHNSYPQTIPSINNPQMPPQHTSPKESQDPNNPNNIAL